MCHGGAGGGYEGGWLGGCSAINYRMERKRLLERAIAILRGYLTVLGVPT